MDILPKELFLIILSYTDYSTHIELVKFIRVNQNKYISQNEYLTLLKYRFPEYIRDNIVDYRKDIIYLELLKHPELKYDNVNMDGFNQYFIYNKYNKIFLKYLTMNDQIVPEADLVAYLDDVDVLELFLGGGGVNDQIDDLVHYAFYHTSINILNYLIDFKDYSLESVPDKYKKLIRYKYDELLIDSKVLLKITKELVHKLYTNMELFRIISHISTNNIDSFKYILDELPTQINSQLIYQIFIEFIDNSDDLEIFVPIWKKYGSQLSKSDYSKLIKQLKLDISRGYGNENVYSFLMSKR